MHLPICQLSVSQAISVGRAYQLLMRIMGTIGY